MNQLISPQSKSPFSPGLPALYSVAFLSGISLGLFNPFISTLMAQHQVDDVWIGANSTVYFIFIALGTPLVSKILRQIGLRRTMILGFALMGLSAPLFPLTNQLPLWFVIRAVMGFSCCLYLISGQTALNYFCNDSNRSIVNGLDALSFSLGFGMGPIIGSVFYEISPQITFSLGSLLVLSGIAVVLVGLPEKVIDFQRPQIKVFKKLILPLQGAFAYGFSVATLVSLYPVYLLGKNYGVEQIGYTFAVFIAGGLLATIPVTHLADKFGKLKVLGTTVFIVVLSLVGLSLVENQVVTQIFAFIAGASMSPVFPLSLALIGAKLSRDKLPSGTVLFTGTYSAGCTAGPLLSSVVMQVFSDRYIFSLMLILFVIFLLKLIKTIKKMGLKFHYY
ncbi:MAG: MFS transporter [Coleofasciculus sp. C1-SOL-03]|uniref:MFS transporter n=1 Tax=Coleofasciculus sp. C1-SOL-03 TaxID=3069522 RepID=UPI0032F61F50